jgi:hypothetical protein
MTRFILSIVALSYVSSSAFGATILYGGTLSGLNEVPPNASPGTGWAVVTIDNTANTMRVQTAFAGLTSGVTASHIHARANAGAGTGGVATTVPTFTGFPSGVTSGTYDHTFDMLLASSWNPAYITANGGTAASAWSVFQTKIASELTYLNIHTTNFGGGELRANLTVVPEPSTLAGLGLAAGALFLRRRKA